MKNKMPFSVMNISVRIDPCGFQYLFRDKDVINYTHQVHIDRSLLFVPCGYLFVNIKVILQIKIYLIPYKKPIIAYQILPTYNFPILTSF